MTQPLNPIVESFINNGCRHMTDIPGNQVFLTDKSASTLVYHEKNVVIEHYLFFPNSEFTLHSHPFDNQVLYLYGQIYGRRRYPGTSEIEETGYYEKLGGPPKIWPITLMGVEHGFTSGPMGAVLYNVQIWPDHVTDPLSAAINFFGPNLGPIHGETIRNFSRTLRK
jgi:hypothetical protein